MQSVATAVIPYTAPAAEYPSPNPRPDLRIQFQRAGSQTIVDPDVYYDAPIYTAGAAPAPDEYQSLADADVSAFVTLPAALNPSLAGVDLPADGSLPSYDSLLIAINTVLAADPGAGANLATLTAAQPLTPDQCRNIAYEIVWGSAPDLPVPSGAIEPMYTNPPNDGGLTNTNEQNRMQFEGQLNSYYATRNAKVERLAKYVYALAAAVWCEQQTQAATRALLRFPVNPPATPTLATVNDAEVILTGALGLDIPAQYFYVLGAQLPLQVTLSQRFAMACGADQQQNLTQLTGAVDDGVIVVPPTAPQPAVNPAQAVRLLSTLAVPAASTAPECPVASAAAVWNDFMAYPATSPPPDNWRSWEPGDDAIDFWPAEFASGAAAVRTAYLALDLYALTAGYIIANSAPPVSLADHIAVHLVVHSPTRRRALFSAGQRSGAGAGVTGRLGNAVQELATAAGCNADRPAAVVHVARYAGRADRGVHPPRPQVFRSPEPGRQCDGSSGNRRADAAAADGRRSDPELRRRVRGADWWHVHVRHGARRGECRCCGRHGISGGSGGASVVEERHSHVERPVRAGRRSWSRQSARREPRVLRRRSPLRARVHECR